MKRDLRIAFMGTPDFAVASLKQLVKNGFKVVAVITAPDKPSGRGLKQGKSAVKIAAEELGLNILQPEKLKAPEVLQQLKDLGVNLQIVVAFRMLPESIWTFPEFGTFNLHASLLPQYRGAAPINWAIINGEKETGVTTFFLKHEIDTGDIIMQEREQIQLTDNFESLYDRLMHKGANLVIKTVKMIEDGSVKTYVQKLDGKEKVAPKIFKETCEIDWNKTSFEIENFVRGLAPVPGAWTIINGKNFKIHRVKILNLSNSNRSGDVPYITDHKSHLYFYSKNGMVSIEEIQMEGKRKMFIEEFLRGNKIE